MRMLVVTNLYPPHYLGGYEVLCKQVVDRLAGRGHDLSVLTSTHGSGESDGTEEGVRVCRTLQLDVPFERPGRVDRLRRLRVGYHNARVFERVFSREQPDIVLVWSQLRLTLGCARAAEATGVPVVYMMNDDHAKSYVPAPWRASPTGLVRYATDRTLFRRTTLADLRMRRITCISQSLRSELIRQGVPAQRSEVIYQGIPIERFPVKAEPGRIEEPARLLYVGQLHPYKGVHTLLEAFRLCSASPMTLSIAGSGEPSYERRLRSLAEGREGVAFLGRLAHEKLPALYREHDIFVFPSIWKEPFGLTHLEAMASGTTVISTTCGGPGEFLVHGENALTFAEEDAADLAKQVSTLLGNHGLSRDLAARARRLAETRFSLDRFAQDLESFYLRALEDGERR